MILVIASKTDVASINIATHLIELGFKGSEREGYIRGNALLRFIETDALYLEKVNRSKFQELIVLSRHESKKKMPMISLHVPGNPRGEAPLGGKPFEVAISHPQRMKTMLSFIVTRKDELPEYSICVEATHHGPTSLNVPVTFVEIGSSMVEWKDDVAGKVVAGAVVEGITEASSDPPTVGLGGGHYAFKLTEASLDLGLALGHVLSNYDLERINVSMMRMILKRSVGPYKCSLMDTSGMKRSLRRELWRMLVDEGINVMEV
jgi:D-aminoacyl-tRNA deacylase